MGAGRMNVASLSSRPPSIGEGKVATPSMTFEDVTHIMRLGLKGPNAATWLEEQGVRVPSRANSWCPVAEDDGDIVARLGSSEFLIETPSRDVRVATIANELGNPIHGVYPVLR